MKISRIVFALTALVLTSGSWSQSLYPLFGPSTGIMKGDPATPVTTSAVSTDVAGLFCGTSTTNFLRADGTCAVPAGAGVTSVALTAPSIFSVTGSPVTSAGTLALAFATGQTANLFLATPNGSTGAAALRAIVGADVPAINLATSGNGGVTGILLGTNGGTSNGFFSVTGPTTALRTFTFPNASATVLTTNVAVTVAQGGTGAATLTGLLKGNGTSAFTAAVSSDVISLWSGTCNSTTFLRADGACASAGGAIGGSSGQMQYNNAGALGGTSGFSWDSTNLMPVLAETSPFINLSATGAGADGKNLLIRGDSGNFSVSTATDAAPQTPVRNIFSTTRSGTAVSSVSIGNTTDQPTVTVPTTRLSVTNTATNFDAQVWCANGQAAGSRCYGVRIGGGGDFQIGISTDAGSIGTSGLVITRSSATAVGTVSIGNATDNPSLSGNGVDLTPATNSYTGTLTGVNATVTNTMKVSRQGNIVCVWTDTDFTGTSNTNALTITGTFPTGFAPAANRVVAVGNMQDNGVSNQIVGQATVAAGGTISLAKLNATPQASTSNWTTSGTKGVNAGWSMCFPK